MDGNTCAPAAVADVRRIKNPILLARAVMEKSPHVMMAGEGAEAFAQSIGMPLVDPSYFPHRRTLAATAESFEGRCREAAACKTSKRPNISAQSARLRWIRTGSSRRRHVHRWHDRQALGPHRRFADHRRRHLCERRLRSIRHRLGRVLHPHGGRTRNLHARHPDARAAETRRR
jgi:hypothetical protein